VAAIVVTGIGMARQELRNQDAWATSWKLSQPVVSHARSAMGPDVRAGSAIVTFRHAVTVLPDDVPVFGSTWDLDGAMKLSYRDASVIARPYGSDAHCVDNGVEWPVYDTGRLTFPSSEQTTLAYGKLWFVDVENRRAVRITTRRECERAAAALAVP
jgi:hypothetical protein